MIFGTRTLSLSGISQNFAVLKILPLVIFSLNLLIYIAYIIEQSLVMTIIQMEFSILSPDNFKIPL